ncbi:MAG: aspartyl protease family protein [Deltaproteobacteria bacterium]|nr:aspartyl protease family protein [Deltaproteobacteria bacterium]
MGQFTVKARIAAPDQAREPQDVEFLVDTGAAFTWLPEEIAEAAGLLPHDRCLVRLADSRQVEKSLAWARMTLEGRTDQTFCLIGDRHSQPLLGAFTLEGFRLSVDPTNRGLVPIIPFVV